MNTIVGTWLIYAGVVFFIAALVNLLLIIPIWFFFFIASGLLLFVCGMALLGEFRGGL